MASEEDDPLWSDIRAAAMPTFDARLFHERAGLQPGEALKWWEQHVLSGEAASAIAAGWSLDDVVRAREASLPIGNAIDFGQRTGLDPADVVSWWQQGVRADEAVEALARGWTLNEAVQLHPSVVERIERTEAERRAAEARRARAEAERRRVGEAQRGREEADRAERERRRSVVDGLDLHVDVDGSPLRFWIAVSEPTYWAVEIDEAERSELGESDSLEACLASVAERVTHFGGTIREVSCKRIGPEQFLAASDVVARACDRLVQIRVKRGEHQRPPEMQRVANNELDDIYDDDADIDRSEATHERFPPGARLLVARRFSVDDHAMLAPALPEAWPSFTRHSDPVVSVGDLFLVRDVTGEGWEPAGRFDDAAEGHAEAEHLLHERSLG